MICYTLFLNCFDLSNNFDPTKFNSLNSNRESISTEVFKLLQNYNEIHSIGKSKVKKNNNIKNGDAISLILDDEESNEYTIDKKNISKNEGKKDLDLKYKQFTITIESDLPKLNIPTDNNNNNWDFYLNDNIVMFFASLFIDSSPRKDECFLCDSINFFNNKYQLKVLRNGVKYAIAPVCQQNHWYLVIYSKKFTMIFNSLSDTTIYPVLKFYEHHAQLKFQSAQNILMDTSNQTNGYDCGIFLLHYLNIFCNSSDYAIDDEKYKVELDSKHMRNILKQFIENCKSQEMESTFRKDVMKVLKDKYCK